MGLVDSAVGAGAKKRSTVWTYWWRQLFCGEIIHLHKSRRSGHELSDLKNGERGEVLIPVHSVKKCLETERVFIQELGLHFSAFFRWSRYLLWKCEMFKMLETVLTVCIGKNLEAQSVYLAADGELPWTFRAVSAWTRSGQLWCVTVFWLGGVKGPDGFDLANYALYSAVVIAFMMHRLGLIFIDMDIISINNNFELIKLIAEIWERGDAAMFPCVLLSELIEMTWKTMKIRIKL